MKFIRDLLAKKKAPVSDTVAAAAPARGELRLEFWFNASPIKALRSTAEALSPVVLPWPEKHLYAVANIDHDARPVRILQQNFGRLFCGDEPRPVGSSRAS